MISKMKSDTTKQLLEQLVQDLKEHNLTRSSIEAEESFLLAANGTYLGTISHPSKANSLLNRKGSYGSSKSDTCIFNKSSIYGSPTGEFSPSNPASQNPPLLFICGKYWGRLSVANISDNKVLPTDKFLYILETDWSKLESGEFSDSGSIHVPVHA